MKIKGDRNPSRFALIVFLVLVVFCLGQLSWWVLFQIQQGKRLLQLQLDGYDRDIQHIVDFTNHDFREQVSRAELELSLPARDSTTVREAFNRFHDHPAVQGYRVTDQAGNILQRGTVDSTFYARLGTDGLLYFDPKYAENHMTGDFVMTVEGFHDGATGSWVTAEMFRLSAEVLEKLERQSNRRLVMFISEGSFFLLVILFGAFMIFRTLQRSEDLKFRQQHFIQAVTHEFRAPLTSLRLYVEALQKGNVKAEKALELFPKMLDDCDRLDGLIDNVLEAGHFGKDGYQLKLAETDLANDLDEYLDGLEPLVSRLGGRLERDLEPDILVRSDYQAFGRVVRALVDNALRYSPPEKRTVRVSLKRNRRSAEIRVADEGIGIPPAEQARIFDRFYRVSDKNARRVHGTGLGLFLVREIVEVHGGKVSAKSAGSNHGAEFIIELPVVQS